MLTKSVLDLFTAYLQLQISALPPADLAPAVANIAMIFRWLYSFDVLFPMAIVAPAFGLTLVIVSGLTIYRAFATIWNFIRGAGA